MTISLTNLKTELYTRLAASPTGVDCCILETANTLFQQGVVYSVANVASLPSATTNQGRLIFVEDIAEYRFSDGKDWVLNTSSVFSSVVYTWGEGGFGQNGDGTSDDRSSPGTTAGGGTNWSVVSSGTDFKLAIKTDGTLWSWGLNSTGQLGDATQINRTSPVTTSGGGTTWCLISAGGAHNTAIKTDGTLWTWGGGGNGVLGTYNNINRSSPGTVAGGGTTWCQVSAQNGQNNAVKTDGTLWTWGQNGNGQLGDGTQIGRCSPGTTAGGGTDWCQVAGSQNSQFGIKTDGTFWAWGFNGEGQLGDGTNIARCSPVTLASGGTTWCQAGSSYRNTLALKTDGTLWTWGRNRCGILGDGSNIDRGSPGTTAGGGTNWCFIGGTALHCSTLNSMSAIKTDGTLWTWGFNNKGNLGDGTTINRSSPGTTLGSDLSWVNSSLAGEGSAGVAATPGFVEPLI